jgi:hypothetical protein
MDIEKLIELYPKLYHMAERDTWSNIERFGLLSTTAILDLHSMTGHERFPYESMHRPEMMTVPARAAPPMVLRDQKPMATERLQKALQNGITPRQWYELLNRKVFFWATPGRLQTLLNARHYRAIVHDVLTIDSSTFFADLHQHIELCHMNSGNTWPYPHPRDATIFKSIPDYPAKANGNPVKDVAEVTISYSVPDIATYVIEVHQFLGSELIGTVHQR